MNTSPFPFRLFPPSVQSSTSYSLNSRNDVLFLNMRSRQDCGHTSAIPALGRWKQKDQESKVILGSIVTLRLTWAT